MSLEYSNIKNKKLHNLSKINKNEFYDLETSNLNKSTVNNKNLKYKFSQFSINKNILLALGIKVIHNNQKINSTFHWISKSNNIYALIYIHEKFRIKNKHLIKNNQPALNVDDFNFDKYDYVYLKNSVLLKDKFHNYSLIRCFIDVLNNNEITPLQYSVYFGNTYLVNILLDLGSYVNHFDIDYFTSLHYAIKTCNLKIIKILILKGADAKACKNIKPYKKYCKFIDKNYNSNEINNLSPLDYVKSNVCNEYLDNSINSSLIHDSTIKSKKRKNIINTIRPNTFIENLLSLRVDLSKINNNNRYDLVVFYYLLIYLIYCILYLVYILVFNFKKNLSCLNISKLLY